MPASPRSTSCTTTWPSPMAPCSGSGIARWPSSASSTGPPARRSSRSGRRSRSRSSCAPSSSRSRRAAPPTRSSSTTPPHWRGSSTSGASTSTHTRSDRATSTIPMSCASTSIPVRGLPGRTCASVALVVREVLEELGYTAWPKTSGSRGIHIYVRIDAAVGRSRMSDARPWRWPARSSAAPPPSRRRNGGRRSATASSSITTRTRRTARWHRSTPCGRDRMRRSARRCGGTRCPRPSSATSRCGRCPTDTRDSETLVRVSRTRRSHSSRCSSW